MIGPGVRIDYAPFIVDRVTPHISVEGAQFFAERDRIPRPRPRADLHAIVRPPLTDSVWPVM